MGDYHTTLAFARRIEDTRARAFAGMDEAERERLIALLDEIEAEEREAIAAGFTASVLAGAR